jgi:hypothetical protein
MSGPEVPPDEAARRQLLALQPNGKKHHVEVTNSPNIKSRDLIII